MSATLDGERFAADGRCAGDRKRGPQPPDRARPPRPLGRKRIEDEMAAAIRRALAEAEGSLLAFLPGVAEIERTAERLEGAAARTSTSTASTAASIPPPSAPPSPPRRPAPQGGARHLIAETSLTLDGVRIVVDSGLARRPRYDRSAGITRLVTERASQASVTQRAGRAGRQAPGTVYRLWEEAATPRACRASTRPRSWKRTCPPAPRLRLWGVADPRALRWLDPPPAAAVDEARRRLLALGALDEDGRPTAHGKAIAACRCRRASPTC
jgi:ATP-dependent helicase HrpB